MASVKKIKTHNSPAFIVDVKKYEIMAYVRSTGAFLKVRKSEVLETAEKMKINYYITDKVFRNKRNVIVIL